MMVDMTVMRATHLSSARRARKLALLKVEIAETADVTVNFGPDAMSGVSQAVKHSSSVVRSIT
jgi:hypothetical protein